MKREIDKPSGYNRNWGKEIPKGKRNKSKRVYIIRGEMRYVYVWRDKKTNNVRIQVVESKFGKYKKQQTKFNEEYNEAVRQALKDDLIKFRNIPPEMLKSMRQLSLVNHEYGGGLDFEEALNVPERALIYHGNPTSVGQEGDMEMRFHTHPYGDNSWMPSGADMALTYLDQPSIVVSTDTVTGKTSYLLIKSALLRDEAGSFDKRLEKIKEAQKEFWKDNPGLVGSFNSRIFKKEYVETLNTYLAKAGIQLELINPAITSIPMNNDTNPEKKIRIIRGRKARYAEYQLLKAALETYPKGSPMYENTQKRMNELKQAEGTLSSWHKQEDINVWEKFELGKTLGITPYQIAKNLISMQDLEDIKSGKRDLKEVIKKNKQETAKIREAAAALKKAGFTAKDINKYRIPISFAKQVAEGKKTKKEIIESMEYNKKLDISPFWIDRMNITPEDMKWAIKNKLDGNDLMFFAKHRNENNVLTPSLKKAFKSLSKMEQFNIINAWGSEAFTSINEANLSVKELKQMGASKEASHGMIKKKLAIVSLKNRKRDDLLQKFEDLPLYQQYAIVGKSWDREDIIKRIEKYFAAKSVKK